MLLLRKTSDLPENLRWNFIHLIGDISWWGVLNGTSLSFVTVYVARIGGDGFQLGLLAAAPAVVNILFAIPFGAWLQGRNTAREIVRFSIYHRIFYLLWIPVPFILSQDMQVWLLILLTFVMNIPGVVLQVGFNDLFADAVPIGWRGYLAGTRNAALAVTSVVSSIVCGQLLTRLSFPLNYQIVFLFGFLGAMFSSVHLYFVWKGLPPKANIAVTEEISKTDQAPMSSLRMMLNLIRSAGNRKFMLLMIGLFGFHTTQFLGIPVFPLYLVNQLKLDDNLISIGNGFFFGVIFIISTQIPRWSRRFSSKRIVVWGAVFMSLYPAVLAFSKSVVPYWIGAGLGGLAWGMAGGLLYNYLLEHIPEGNRSPYLAFYNFIQFSAVLVGSLSGPLFVEWMGISNALLLIAVLRFAAGLLLFRLG